jgi:hypothetical protein
MATWLQLVVFRDELPHFAKCGSLMRLWLQPFWLYV